MHFPLSKFLQKRSPPTFSMVHLLHRLYGVARPWPVPFTNWVNLPAVLVVGPIAMRNWSFSSLTVAITVASTRCACPQQDRMARLSWPRWLLVTYQDNFAARRRRATLLPRQNHQPHSISQRVKLTRPVVVHICYFFVTVWTLLPSTRTPIPRYPASITSIP